MLKKVSKKIMFLLVVLIIGGLGGVLADRLLFPYLSSTKPFSKYDFIKRFTEDVTIINKTEQVFVKEETSISKISSQVSSSVVNILSYPDLESGTYPVRNENQTSPKNGTGIIVTGDGLIVSYLSAINPENSKYKITTSEGTGYDAEFIGTDSYSNLAFFKIDAGNLPAISFGDSDDSQPGEKVIAVGNSFGAYSNRYAAGLLSGFNPTYNLSGKALSFSDKLEGVFETDFNSGESYVGGPIADYAGQTIGIIGSIEKDGGESYFQIPSNKIKKVIDRAIKKELDKSPSLGVYYIPITQAYALNNSLKTDKGAMIFSPSGQQGLAIIAGSAGQKAGLRINDIIKAVGGQEINLQNTLPDLLYQYKQGETVELTIIRAGEEIKITVAL